MKNTLLPSVLTHSQKKKFGPKFYTERGQKYRITADVRHDDQCHNGHNTFSITGSIDRVERGVWVDDSGGCIHKEIAKHFPELAPMIKWHLVSTDGPMHYPGNVTYMAGERDCWGMLKGEFRQHTSRGPHQAGGVAGVPLWELVMPEVREIYANEKPAPVTLEWRPYGKTGDGKARELSAARSCAVWPEATDAELSVSKEELEAKLMERLPQLMLEFRADVESLGFVY